MEHWARTKPAVPREPDWSSNLLAWPLEPAGKLAHSWPSSEEASSGGSRETTMPSSFPATFRAAAKSEL